MKIKVWNYLIEYEKEKQEIHQAIEEVLTSGQLILGEKVRAFENAFSSYCGLEFGVGVDNGTDALFIALRALGIGAGDEVITVANTAVPTVSAITATGAKAVFVDIQEESFLINCNSIENAISPATKCILPVHLFGQCADMDRITQIASNHNLFIIEDCAQSHGAEYKGRKAGSMSHLAAFSFYPTKILGTYGDGGMVITGDPNLNEKLRRLRFYGMEKTYYSNGEGYNSRLDELHASILLKKLTHLKDYIDRRRLLAERYNEMLAETSLTLPREMPDCRHAYYLYVVRHPKRDKIMEELKNRNVHVNISYPWPIHTMTGFGNLGYSEGDLPVTEKIANEIFSLPMYPSLTEPEQDYVIRNLIDITNQL